MSLHRAFNQDEKSPFPSRDLRPSDAWKCFWTHSRSLVDVDDPPELCCARVSFLRTDASGSVSVFNARCRPMYLLEKASLKLDPSKPAEALQLL